MAIETPLKEPAQPVEQQPVTSPWLPEPATLFFKDYWPLILLTLLVYFGRLATMPGFVESKDGLFFLRGIQRYSVSEVRPQWPGYPVYIWVGKLLNLFYGDRILALHMVSIVASTLTLWPIAGLAGIWLRAIKPGGQGGNEMGQLHCGYDLGFITPLLAGR